MTSEADTDLGTDAGPVSTAGSIPGVLGAVLLVAAVAAQLLRTRGIPVWDTIWLEDADVFVEQANRYGPFEVLLRGYGGYVQLLPRLLAVPTAWIPVGSIPLYLAVAGAVTSTAVAAFVYRSLGGWVEHAAVRVAVAAMVVVGPALAIENTALVTNTIWALYLAVPFAVLSRRERTGDVAARCAVAALAAASMALSAIYLPVALVVAVRRRRLADRAVAVALGAGLALQLAVVATTDAAETGDSSVRTVVDMYAVRVVGSFLVGERPLDRLWTGTGEPVAVAFLLVAVALFGVLLAAARRRERTAAACFLVGSVLCFAVPVWLRGSELSGFGLDAYTQSWTRYTVAPIVFLVTAVALLVDPHPPSTDRPWGRTARTAFLVQTAIVVVVGLPVTTVRSAGPRWSDEVAAAREVCEGEAGDTVVALTTSPPNFASELPCRRLR